MLPTSFTNQLWADSGLLCAGGEWGGLVPTACPFEEDSTWAALACPLLGTSGYNYRLFQNGKLTDHSLASWPYFLYLPPVLSQLLKITSEGVFFYEWLTCLHICLAIVMYRKCFWLPTDLDIFHCGIWARHKCQSIMFWAYPIIFICLNLGHFSLLHPLKRHRVWTL